MTRESLVEGLIARNLYFEKNIANNPLFKPEFESSKIIIEIITGKEKSCKNDFIKILTIISEVETGEHYNGSGWYDFKIQVNAFIHHHGFNMESLTPNTELITNFYRAFQQKDYKTMQACYADNATFSDPVFENLNTAEVKAMWEMLITRGKDLQLEFKNVEANDTIGSAEWIATYTFSATGNKVVNKIKASFVLENGKIVKHIDDFDFYTWAKQALGFKGLLLGWTSFLHNKVKQGAKTNLAKFMGSRQS